MTNEIQTNLADCTPRSFGRFGGDDYLLRRPTPDDLNLIYKSWTKAVKQTIPYLYIPDALFIPRQQEHITKCLNHYQTWVIADRTEPSEVFGFINYLMIADTCVLNWLYIKQIWRKQGLMDSVLTKVYGDWRKKPIILTQMNKYYSLLNKRYHLSFDPYYIGEH